MNWNKLYKESGDRENDIRGNRNERQILNDIGDYFFDTLGGDNVEYPSLAPIVSIKYKGKWYAVEVTEER